MYVEVRNITNRLVLPKGVRFLGDTKVTLCSNFSLIDNQEGEMNIELMLKFEHPSIDDDFILLDADTVLSSEALKVLIQSKSSWEKVRRLLLKPNIWYPSVLEVPTYVALREHMRRWNFVVEDDDTSRIRIERYRADDIYVSFQDNKDIGRFIGNDSEAEEERQLA